MRPFALARLIGLALFAVRVGVLDTLELLRNRPLHDYSTFHAAACAVRELVSPYQTDELLFGAASCRVHVVHPYLYPPLLAELLVPFTFFAPWTARLIWHALSVLAAFASVWLLDRWVGERDRGDELRAALAVVVGSFWPIRETHLMGQVNSIVLLLLVVWWTRRDRSDRAAVALGAAVAIKMSPALLLLVPLVDKRWRELAWGAASAGALIVASCLVIPANGADFLGSVLGGFLPGHRYHGLTVPIDLFGNNSIAAVLWRLTKQTDPLRLSMPAALLQLLIVGTMLGVWLRRARRLPEHARGAALVIVMIIATSYAYEHHAAFALLAIAMLLTEAPSMGLRYTIVGAVAVAFMADRLEYYLLPNRHYPRALLAIARSPKLPSLLALYALGLFAIRTAKPDATTRPERTSPRPSDAAP